MQLFERLPRETGHAYALRTIRENIVNLTLKPGSQISENELAGELGLSRTPVREALADLARVKMIEICPQKKSIVSLIDYSLVEEYQFMRYMLEMGVLELVCDKATEENLRTLRENVRLQQFCLEHFNAQALMELDNQFHATLFDIAEKPMVYRLMTTVSIHFDRIRSLALVSVKNLKIVQDHENILTAIEQHDIKTAQEIMKEHLSRYRVDAITIREKFPQYMKN